MIQTKDYMLTFLRKVQEAQIKVVSLDSNYSMHVDAGSSRYYSGEYGVNFCVSLFKGIEMIGYWDFHYLDDSDSLQHTFDDLMFHLKRL